MGGPSLILLLVLVIVSFCVQAFTVQVYSSDILLSETSYTILGFASSMQDFSLDVRFGTVFSQVTFILFALSTILLHMCLLLFIWYVRIKPRLWARLHTLAQTLIAWSALDVMVASMVITLLEMETLHPARFSTSQLALAGKLLGRELKNPYAVRLMITLEAGTYLMGAAALIHTVLAQLVMIMLDRAIPHCHATPLEANMLTWPATTVHPDVLSPPPRTINSEDGRVGPREVSRSLQIGTGSFSG